MNYVHHILSAAGACIALASCAAAQTPLLPADPLAAYTYYDAIAGGSATRVTVEGQPFSTAVRIATAGTGGRVYDAQLAWNTTSAVAEGDLILLSFWARRIAPLDGRSIDAQVVFEREGGDYVHSLTATFPNDTAQWQRYSIPFRAAADHPAAGARLAFQFAIGPQVFEIGGVNALNYGPNTNVGTLSTAFYYPGRDANAPWRAQAQARINQSRKGAATIRVVDCDGTPVPNASVRLVQTNHAFKFGTAVAADRLVGSGPDSDIFRTTFLANFNSAVIENHLKWPFWETWGQPAGTQALLWLSQRAVPTRGHNLIWPGFGNMPGDCAALGAGSLRARIDAHFAQILNATRGKLYEWDVVNEPFSNFDVMGRIEGVDGVATSSGTLGNAELLRWFNLARAADPAIGLVLNDYNVLEGVDPTHRAYTAALVRWLLQQNAPVTGLGLQGHFRNAVIPIPELESRLATLTSLPVRLTITEYDIDTLDELLQANYTRDFLTLIFSQPRFDGFFLWGFWEGAHWIPNAAFYRRDWTPKPVAAVWRDLIYSQWHTDQSGSVDSQGLFTTAAFFGDYRIEITVPGVAASQSLVTFAPGTPTLTVVANAGLSRQPDSISLCSGEAATFTAMASGTGPFAYQWEFMANNGVWADLVNGLVPGVGTISGATTTTVTVANPLAASIQFRCVVANVGSSCGAASSITSAPATLLVCPCLACVGDFNQDGGVDGGDVEAFFVDWQRATGCADTNQDGGIDGRDVEAFFVAWQAGGC